MKLISYFLGLNIVLASSQAAGINSILLERIESSVKRLDARLAKNPLMKARQNRDLRKYLRLDDSSTDYKDDMDFKHGKTVLLLSNTFILSNYLKANDKRLEAAQNIVIDKIQQLINKTDICSRNENIDVMCPTQTTVSSTKPVTAPSTTTVRLKIPITTITTPARTSPTSAAPTASTAQTSCKRVDQRGNVKEGVYKLDLPGERQIQVFCSAGYMTIQRRFNGALNFDRTFAEYERGFGDVSGESWLGLTYLHELTTSAGCSLKIVLNIDSTTHLNRYFCGSSYKSDCNGKKKKILADNFSISSASDLYRIQVTVNSTNFKNPSVEDDISGMNGQQFTTKDKGPMSVCAGYGAVPAAFWYDWTCDPGLPNSVVTTTDTNDCSSSNKVCGYWYPYHFITSWIQFRC